MIILIAESKTMLSSSIQISENNFEDNKPIFEEFADNIADYLSGFSVPELALRLKISDTLAVKAKKLLYDFRFKQTGNIAINAFTGDVFKALDISSLSEAQHQYVINNLRIISSMYGLLSPTNIIKSYRLDYNVDGAPDGENLSKFWRKHVTVALAKILKDSGESQILDLLPGDASRLIDWKVIKAFAKVYKIDFKTFEASGLKTPHAGMIKNFRGRFIRDLASNNITNLKDILEMESSQFIYMPAVSRKDYPVFTSALP